MKVLLYLIRKTIKNSLKELKNHPAKLVLYILFFAFLAFILIFSIIMKRENTHGISTAAFKSICLSIVIFFFYTTISTGRKRGGSFFRQSDVNFLFTAPISPQDVLIYGFVKQLFTTFIFMIFFLFQVPNIYNFVPLADFGMPFIFIAVFLLMFSTSILSILTYSISNLSDKHRDITGKIIYALMILFICGLLYQILFYKDLKTAYIAYANLKFFDYIPFLGWLMQIFMSAVDGITIRTLVYILLCITTMIVMAYSLYKINADYYEDALNVTAVNEAAREKAKSGMYNFNSYNKNKVKSVKNAYKSFGAKAIFERQLLEFKKEGFIFLDKKTLIFLFSSYIFCYFTRDISIITLLYFSTYMLLLFSAQTKWNLELKRPYIYMLPESSMSKIFYSSTIDNLKNLVDGIALFMPAAFIYKENPVIALLCIFSYLSFGAVFIYGDMLMRRIFGININQMVESFSKLILMIVAVLPGIIISSVIIFTNNTFASKCIGFMVLISYNTLLSLFCILLSRKLFENIEMR